MNIYSRKRITESIPIVPMLDILTILLIFFIVQTEFKRQVKVLNIDLPHTEHIAGENGERNQILLEIDASGNIALAGKQLTIDEISTAIKKLHEKSPDAQLQVAAAQGAAMGNFIKILDTLTEAGLDIYKIPVRIDPKD